jgi:hypothetical protein
VHAIGACVAECELLLMLVDARSIAGGRDLAGKCGVGAKYLYGLEDDEI